MSAANIKDLILEVKKLRTSGQLQDPVQTEQLYIYECRAQSDYTPDEGECQYTNGQILDVDTGKPVKPDIADAIHGRVKLRSANESTAGDSIIRKLSNMKGFGEG